MTTGDRHRRRELERNVLYALARFQGSGWATAADIARLLHGKDGRRVAGALRRLQRLGLVTMRYDDGHIDPHDLASWHFIGEYHTTDTGLRWLEELAANELRLADDTSEVIARHRVQQREREKQRVHRVAVQQRRHLRALP
jgi:DNA-binding transcriptional ArsR family regulator